MPPAPQTIKVGNSPSLGSYLVDGNGMALYWTSRDAVGVSNITGTVLANWSAFYTKDIIVRTPLLPGDLGSINRTDGSPQTTYKGWPLYYYIKDTAAGDTLGQGLGGVWFVINPGDARPQGTAVTTPASVTIDLIAQNMVFDKSTLNASVGAAVTINFTNKDSGIPHYFALYTTGDMATGTASGKIFVGDIITGPASITYTFTAPTKAGTYFFRCDPHATRMTGSFIVQ